MTSTFFHFGRKFRLIEKQTITMKFRNEEKIIVLVLGISNYFLLFCRTKYFCNVNDKRSYKDFKKIQS